MSIAPSSETSCSTTHFRFKKDFFLLRVFPSRIYENDRQLRMVAHWFAEEMTRARISTIWDKWAQA